MAFSDKINPPIVSVVLPTFNRVKYLPACIDSILAQTFQGFEIIVVDDGSTDHTWELLDRYIGVYDRIRAYKHRNRGLPAAYNVGIALAEGKYISLINSDDTYLETHLEKRIEYFKNNPDLDMVHDGLLINGDEYCIDRHDFSKKIHLSECAVGGTFFGLSHVYRDLGGFRNIRYGEDADLIERAEKRFCVHRVAQFKTYVFNRNTPDSICQNLGPNDLEDHK